MIEYASLRHTIDIHRYPFKKASFLLDSAQDPPRPPTWKTARGDIRDYRSSVQSFGFNNLFRPLEIDICGSSTFYLFI
jgi:hypothetical protein